MVARSVLRVCNTIVNLFLGVALLICGAYAGYVLWDNAQVHTAAQNVHQDLIRVKPVTDTLQTDGVGVPSFEGLLTINPDVCGWITMDGTGIDYPVLRGENNLSYINTDIYGEFALAGSIFLDSRNSAAFSDPYSLLYGHHMADGSMFGDLTRYKEEAFFRENCSGKLILPDGVYDLEIISCMLVGAADQWIFTPDYQQDDIHTLLDYAQEHALHLNTQGMAKARQREDLQILALSTCSSEFTDARAIVLTIMTPHESE